VRLPSDDQGQIDNELLFEGCVGSILLMSTLQENVRMIQRVDQLIENDLEEHFQLWVPMSSNV
jgi:hypothetical protein